MPKLKLSAPARLHKTIPFLLLLLLLFCGRTSFGQELNQDASPYGLSIEELSDRLKSRSQYTYFDTRYVLAVIQANVLSKFDIVCTNKNRRPPITPTLTLFFDSQAPPHVVTTPMHITLHSFKDSKGRWIVQSCTITGSIFDLEPLLTLWPHGDNITAPNGTQVYTTKRLQDSIIYSHEKLGFARITIINRKIKSPREFESKFKIAPDTLKVNYGRSLN